MLWSEPNSHEMTTYSWSWHSLRSVTSRYAYIASWSRWSFWTWETLYK